MQLTAKRFPLIIQTRTAGRSYGSATDTNPDAVPFDQTTLPVGSVYELAADETLVAVRELTPTQASVEPAMGEGAGGNDN